VVEPPRDRRRRPPVCSFARAAARQWVVPARRLLAGRLLLCVVSLHTHTEAATEAVAQAHGLAFHYARQERAPEVRRVREIARERAEERARPWPTRRSRMKMCSGSARSGVRPRALPLRAPCQPLGCGHGSSPRQMWCCLH
jgi:hypothetical protein